MPTESPWDIPCKLCNVGTYVKRGHGISAKDCEVCPEGTNKTIYAGYRACYCQENYARLDRYGPCYICTDQGLNCSNGHQSLLPGYMWNWSFPNANISYYRAFVANLQVDYDHANTPTRYTGVVPRIHECPRYESCQNDKDSISGNCEKGYTGWLCSNCEPGYYSVLNDCVPCPNLAVLMVETCVFLSVCSTVCFLLGWRRKRKDANQRDKRSLMDVMMARIKILLGFYQVVGEIFASLHDIKWTGPLQIMGKFISTFEINILRLFIRPRCFDIRLDVDPKAQFIIGAISPIVIVAIPFLIYQMKKLYVLIRYTTASRISFRSHFENLKAHSFACVVVLWFVIYPPVCSVIFSLYPICCKTFSLDKDSKYNITRLRSDFDVDCTELEAYHIAAFILTITYVFAFPAGLLGVLCRYHFHKMKAASTSEQVAPRNAEDENVSVINNGLPNSPHFYPMWLIFLTENYKENFWYWEIVELARKVTQTLLITLFGLEDRLTVIITTCISVLFLLLHARFRPMKSSYEQGLQVLSI